VFLLKFGFILFLLFVFQFMGVERALAWGPGVHTVIALGTLENVGLILPAIARMLTLFPLQYVYGCLAADFFIGKSQGRRTESAHSWEGGFRFLREASDDEEAAYAYGFLSHLAADVVAHNFFIPNVMTAYAARRRMGHLYWEVKADQVVGSVYTKIARDVLSTDHKGCDALLHLISGKRINGLKAKKQLYAQSVKFSNYLSTTHDLFFTGEGIRGRMFRKNLGLMIDLSRRCVEDFLGHPESSWCLSYSPIAARDLRLVKGRRLLKRLFNPRHRTRSYGTTRPSSHERY
jgi:hypothetical protein